jgi:putative molybdopterin biosynthesis protein
MAGFHTRERPPRGSLSQRTYQPLLKPGLHKLVGFARRTQGLIVAPGNPLGLRTMADVARKRARYVNRAMGTGTRVLFDELLDEASLSPEAIAGHERSEPSHAAVAQAVVSGKADAGLALESAARAAGLGFVPLVQERYHLACLKTALEQPATRALLTVLRGAAWQHQLGTLPGYESVASGQVQSLSTLLPWWTFKDRKPPGVS